MCHCHVSIAQCPTAQRLLCDKRIRHTTSTYHSAIRSTRPHDNLLSEDSYASLTEPKTTIDIARSIFRLAKVGFDLPGILIGYQQTWITQATAWPITLVLGHGPLYSEEGGRGRSSMHSPMPADPGHRQVRRHSCQSLHPCPRSGGTRPWSSTRSRHRSSKCDEEICLCGLLRRIDLCYGKLRRRGLSRC